MNKFIKFIRKIRRYRTIVNILVKYGFEIFLERIHISIFPFKKKKKIESSFPVRIRKILEELGPTFIKLGQILSTRPDLIPLEYIKELENLQDNVKPENFQLMKEIIENQLNKKLEEIFDEFDEQPIASASLSCVYRAIYKNKKVAVKVQRPYIKQQIFTDIEILYDIANLIERFIKESEIYQPTKIVKEFEKNIKKELNFIIEVKNIEIMKEKMKNFERLFIPDVYKEICTEKILVTEYIDGIKINKVEQWSRFVSKEEVLKNGTDIILKQIFDIGLFHGDPHPGNIFIMKDGRIALIDFGIVGHLDEERKYYIINLLSGIIKGQTNKIIYTLKLMGSLNEKVDIQELKDEIEDMIKLYRDIPVKEIKIGEVFGLFYDIIRQYRIKIPISFSLMSKSIITLEGICNFIEPDFKLTEAIEPFFIEIIEKKVKFSYFLKEFQDIFYRFHYTIKEIPETIETFLETVKNFKKKNYENENIHGDLNRTIKKTSLKISFSIFISSFLLCSTFLFFISDYFIFGITGFFLSAILILIFLLKLRG
ncbi:MAG: AarF/UbiB family protein [Candidatus Omnitrophica bacterium]|nr:AarF/UbiB family protein [Candidatus Omnitrophota bacterium]MCM8801946.1 AarF/UbiB family protein [Candidatus Omnitrophota bacterium]